MDAQMWSHSLLSATVGAVAALGLSGLAGEPPRGPSAAHVHDHGPGPSADRTAVVMQPPDASGLSGSGDDAVRSGTGEARAAESQQCSVEVAAGELCAHDSEPPPPGVDTRALPTVAQLRSRRFGAPGPRVPGHPGRDAPRGPTPDAAGTDAGSVTPEEVATTGLVPCVGDGTTGPRVQAIYAHASDTPNRYTEVLPLLTQYAADVSSRINASAGVSGEGRIVSFVTTGDSPCVLQVENVTLSPGGDDTFAASVRELQAKGYSRPDRKYLVWMDAAVGICGIGHVYDDDRPGPDNLNTRGNMFARADAPCWGYAELHELLHTLGAVQDTSAHSTGAGHCVDEQDTMCYSDTSGASMRELCPQAPQWNVDCGLDDYFNAAPAAGSYLQDHWNTARSPYLSTVAAPPPPPRMTVSSRVSSWAGVAWTVKADLDLPEGRSVESFVWTSSRPDCRFRDPRATSTVFWCPVTAAGAGQVTARLQDDAAPEVTRSVPFTLTVPSDPRRVALGLERSRSTVRAGRAASLTGHLADARTGNRVVGMPVALYRRIAGRGTWDKVATVSTSARGTFRFTVTPRRTTYYRAVSGYTRTWASGSSADRRVSVR